MMCVVAGLKVLRQVGTFQTATTVNYLIVYHKRLWLLSAIEVDKSSEIGTFAWHFLYKCWPLKWQKTLILMLHCRQLQDIASIWITSLGMLSVNWSEVKCCRWWTELSDWPANIRKYLKCLLVFPVVSGYKGTVNPSLCCTYTPVF